MLVSEIWDAARSSRGYGTCSNDKLYQAITEAVRILSDKGSWDWMVGYMTLCAYDGYVTMPDEVETVLGATVNGYPAWARDRWYVHHINGAGNYSQIDSYFKFYDEVNEVSTFRCVPEASLLVGIPEESSDDGKEMLVYGYDWTGKELFHIDSTTGKPVKGIRVPITTQDPPPYIDPIVVSRVTKVVKPLTDGMVNLWSFPNCWDDDSEATMIGRYYPFQTEPRYRQYRFTKGSCVSIHFRRKDLRFHSQNDFIPFDNDTALLMMLKAIRHYHEGNLGGGQPLEDKATQLLRDSERARKAKNDIGPQFKNFSSDNQERLRGGYRRTSRGGSCC